MTAMSCAEAEAAVAAADTVEFNLRKTIDKLKTRINGSIYANRVSHSHELHSNSAI